MESHSKCPALFYVREADELIELHVDDGHAVIMAEGMRLHAHSRGQASVALSSCDAEVMAASEGIKEALLLRGVLMSAGLGRNEIVIKVD